MRQVGWVRGTLACVALATVAACTTDPVARRTPVADPSASDRDSASSSDTPSASAGPRCTEPLVLARHHARGPFRLTERRARALVDGGGTSGSVTAAVRDRALVAVLPASRVDARVRVAVVDGVHPLRRPRAYPLQTEVADPSSCPPRPTTMTVVGDVMLARGVADAAGGDLRRPLRATSARLRAPDLTVGNLESTLSRAGAPTQGGDSFGADPSAAAALVDAGFDVLSLANNHTGDFGPQALRQTVTRLRSAGLATFGAGRDLAAAREPSVLDVRGTRFGFVGFNAIGETPEAAPGTPGALSVSMPPRTGPLDRRELSRFLGDVRRLDRRVDVVVVLPHWGTQYTNRPEPVQRRVARKVVAAGADLVVGGHPHWVQGASSVGDALVVQSLGNFVFDMDFMAETMVGVALETTWWGGELKAAEPVPYRMDASFTPRFVSWDEGRPTLRLMGASGGPAYRF